jgi:hypothetical protein
VLHGFKFLSYDLLSIKSAVKSGYKFKTLANVNIYLRNRPGFPETLSCGFVLMVLARKVMVGVITQFKLAKLIPYMYYLPGHFHFDFGITSE